MKKTLILAFSFMVLLFTGCSKDDEPKLSEFIIGEWTTGAITIPSVGKFEIFIQFTDNNKYYLSVDVITDEQNGALIGNYKVDNKAKTLQVEGDFLEGIGMEGSGDPIMFDVVMNTTPNGDQMILTPQNKELMIPTLTLSRTMPTK